MPVIVTINPAPTVVITNPAAVCAPATVDLTSAAVTAGSTAGLTYYLLYDAAGTITLATPNAVGATEHIISKEQQPQVVLLLLCPLLLLLIQYQLL